MMGASPRESEGPALACAGTAEGAGGWGAFFAGTSSFASSEPLRGLACNTIPQCLHFTGWFNQSAGMRSTFLQPGHLAWTTSGIGETQLLKRLQHGATKRYSLGHYR